MKVEGRKGGKHRGETEGQRKKGVGTGTGGMGIEGRSRRLLPNRKRSSARGGALVEGAPPSIKRFGVEGRPLWKKNPFFCGRDNGKGGLGIHHLL